MKIKTDKCGRLPDRGLGDDVLNPTPKPNKQKQK